MRIEILGVPVDAVTRAGAGEVVEAMLGEQGPHLVTTPNPEMLVAASRDAEFKKVLKKADLAIPDGVGLLWAARWQDRRLPERVSGVEFMEDVCRIAAMKGVGVFLLGGRGDVAKRAAKVLEARYAGLRVVGTESGGDVAVDADGVPHIDEAAMDRIIDQAPHVLFAAFGHGTQEKWLVSHMAMLPSVRIGMGVGGSFDFIAGDVKRAPSWVRSLGLEWLWRLILQPWRVGRIWAAVVTFPWLVLTRKG